MSAVKHDFHFRICAWPGQWLLNSVCYNVCRKEHKKAEKEDTWTLDEIWNKVHTGGDAKKRVNYYITPSKQRGVPSTLVFDFQDNFLVI